MTKDRARAKAAQYLEWADKAETSSKSLMDTFHKDYKDFDWTQPILRGHHSQRRHEKVFAHRDSVFSRSIELDAKAKRFREKAENLLQFANTNKGDADARREAKRAVADKLFTKGSTVVDPCYGQGIITRVNKKTYTVDFDRGCSGTRDKSYFVL